MNDLVSIITPSYNSSRFISQTIESVLSQTYKNWEMIIIDDVSTDDSNVIIENYIKNDVRIKLIKSEINSGPAVSRNTGIKEAKGKYLTFIDSDDLWDKEFIQKSIDFILLNHYSFIFSSYRIVDENLVKLHDDYIVPKKLNYSDLLKSNRISCLTAFIDISKVGKYYMDNVGHEDYTLWLKLLRNIDFAYGIEEPLANYRLHSSSRSANKLKAATWTWNIYRNIENLSILKSIYYFINYAYNGIMKYRYWKKR